MAIIVPYNSMGGPLLFLRNRRECLLFFRLSVSLGATQPNNRGPLLARTVHAQGGRGRKRSTLAPRSRVIAPCHGHGRREKQKGIRIRVGHHGLILH